MFLLQQCTNTVHAMCADYNLHKLRNTNLSVPFKRNVKTLDYMCTLH